MCNVTSHLDKYPFQPGSPYRQDLPHYNRKMRKNTHLAWGIAIILIVFSISPIHAEAESHLAPHFSSPGELVDAVNALRASHGLAPYQANPILMSIAQAQAEYLLSIGTISHTGPGGSRPFERALEAGYPVAGDLSQGGFFSENVTAGVGQTAEDAVEIWTGDAAHMNTMLSGTLQDVGAGVGVNGNTYYYVLDAGVSTGGTPVAYTPPPGRAPSTPTIIPNTPNADGSILHIIQTGDTLGSLSLAYNVPLADLLKLNNLTLKSILYVGNKIVIRTAYTPTPTQPTGTPTIRPTMTEWPTPTLEPTRPPSSPTPTPAPVLPVSSAKGAVYVIVLVAVVVAGGITFLGSRNRGKKTGA
jgi:LysM repeat protein